MTTNRSATRAVCGQRSGCCRVDGRARQPLTTRTFVLFMRPSCKLSRRSPKELSRWRFLSSRGFVVGRGVGRRQLGFGLSGRLIAAKGRLIVEKLDKTTFSLWTPTTVRYRGKFAVASSGAMAISARCEPQFSFPSNTTRLCFDTKPGRNRFWQQTTLLARWVKRREPSPRPPRPSPK
jgi:hypothetical protein